MSDELKDLDDGLPRILDMSQVRYVDELAGQLSGGMTADGEVDTLLAFRCLFRDASPDDPTTEERVLLLYVDQAIILHDLICDLLDLLMDPEIDLNSKGPE